MRKLLPKEILTIPRNSFVSNFLITAFGSSTAYVIGLLFTPIISRIYGPEAYGNFAIFNTLMLNLSILSTFGYEQAMMISTNKRELMGLTRLNVLLMISFCLVLFLVILVTPEFLLFKLGLNELGSWLLLLPLLVTFNVLSQIVTNLGLVLKDFSRVSQSRVISTLSAKSYALLHSLLLVPDFVGFVLGELTSRISIVLRLFANKRSRAIFLFSQKKVSTSDLKAVSHVYRQYPMYQLPAIWIVNLSSLIPTYLLFNFYGSENAGYYSMALMLILLPINLLSRSTGTVFLQKAAELRNTDNTGALKKQTHKLTLTLIISSILPLALILLLGEPLFVFVLGDQWGQSGIMAKYLCIQLFSDMIVIPLLPLFRVLRLERIYLKLSIFSILISLAIYLLGLQFDDVMMFVLAIAIAKLLDNVLKGSVLILKLQNSAV